MRKLVEMDSHDILGAWRNTYACACFYGVLVLLNLGIFSYEVATQSYDGEMYMLGLDALINFCLLTEMAASIYTYGIRAYFKSILNIVDFVVSSSCTILLIYTLSDLLTAEEYRIDWLETILLVLRYIFWLVRLLLVLYRGQQKADFFTDQEDVPHIRECELEEISHRHAYEHDSQLLELRSLIGNSIHKHEDMHMGLQSHSKHRRGSTGSTTGGRPGTADDHKGTAESSQSSEDSSFAFSDDERHKRVGFL
jgi:hypothetical protein